MTTQEVASKWANYCRTGETGKAYAELYDPNCLSIEMKGAQGYPEKAVGMDEIAKKGEMWNSMVEEFHSMEVSEPLVVGNHFTSHLKMDLTMKGRGRIQDEEIGIYRVENGKIVMEQYFYELG